jgi:hypothetical protein
MDEQQFRRTTIASENLPIRKIVVAPEILFLLSDSLLYCTLD